MLTSEWQHPAGADDPHDRVEVRLCGEYIEVRNTAWPDDVLSFTPAEWDAFTAGVNAGEFDLEEEPTMEGG